MSINNCSFNNNTATFNCGALVYSDKLSDSIAVLIDQCTFQYNSTWKAGGAIGLNAMNNSYVISNCLFENNNAGFGGSDDTGITVGGAIGLGYNAWILEPPDSVVHIVNCTFKNNTSDYGGAIFLGNVHLNTINCLFDENAAGIGGGAVYSERGYYYHTDFNVINSTFTKNFSYERGGLFFCNDMNDIFWDKSTLNIINSIVWDNQSIQGSNKLILRGVHFKMEHSVVDFETCDTSIVDLANNNSNSYTLTCGNGMLFNENPLFKDTANHVYELDLCSPAINAGNTLAIDSFGLLYDLQGNERIQSGVVDIGAFENGDFSASVFQINPVSCFGGNDGHINFDITGCPPFVFQWDKGNETGQGIDSLIAGSYFITVSDSVGQMQVVEVMLSEPPEIEIDFTTSDATAMDSMNGGIFITSISGGSPPYFVSWNTGDTTFVLENLLPGNYDLTVTDANACEQVFSIPVDFTSNTALTEYADYRIFVHPNPANTFVNLTFNKPLISSNLTWTLMATNGQIIQTEKLNQQYTGFNIGLKNIPAGLYFWKIEANQTLITVDKLIIAESR